MKSKIIIAFTILLVFTCFISCNTFKDNELSNYTESIKNINGIWQLKTVSRNGIDISNTMDFSQFRLHLNVDGSYTLENYLPFAVKKDGQWKVDDPQYPFKLIFRENNSTTDVTIGLQYPIVAGKRIISISLSPGCSSNTYIYEFDKN
jgi:hypothetical protein